MRVGLHIILCLLLHFTSRSQDIDIDAYIKAWKTDDISQTHKSAVFFDRLDQEKDTVKYRRTLVALYDYVKKHA